ncbi:MAG TPA: aromatic amino acid transport family protein [Candidatus Paceibacterota bacterium]|nr:aromatic amino acid transport family protein [Candidatus Paceibacterota bacterium]
MVKARGKAAQFFEIAGIVAAATVGDGVFALPFVFYVAGWAVGLAYLAILGLFVVVAHVVYLETLEKEGEKERLLGLAEHHFGRFGFWLGFLAIVIGLLLTLVAYLILGTNFIGLALPGVPTAYAFIVFWVFISAIALASDKELRALELTGIACTSAIIVIIFFSAWPNILFPGVPAINPQNIFLPFGAILFSLAGWTSIEPAYEARKKHERKSNSPWRALAMGTLFAALLYAMFASGIIGSATSAMITPDTASGLAAWPLWKKDLLAALGLLAVATVYLPISREIKNSLEKDLHWPKGSSRPLVVLLPPILIFLGLNNFLAVVGLVGGAFLSLQYLLIISVGRKSLKLNLAQGILLDLIGAVFIVAAVYSVYAFVVR